MENRCQSIIKYLIFLFNVVFAVTGLALIGLGAYAHSEANYFLDEPAYSSISYSDFINSCVFFVIIGFIIFIISFFGCCGSLLENKCMIYTYAILLAVIVLAEMFVGVCAYIAMAEMKTSMAEYGKPGYEGVDEMWDLVQKELTCCGVKSYEDWEANLPASCCDAALGSCNVNNVYAEGCFGKMDAVLKAVAIAAVGITLLQVIIISFACWIGRRSGRRDDKEYLTLIERY